MIYTGNVVLKLKEGWEILGDTMFWDMEDEISVKNTVKVNIFDKNQQLTGKGLELTIGNQDAISNFVIHNIRSSMPIDTTLKD